MDFKQLSDDLVDKAIYPEDHLTDDQLVELVNTAADDLRKRMAQGEDLDDEASNFVVWLGGLHKDIMLYGLQRILKPKPLDVVFEDKAQARIDTMEVQLDRCKGYIAKSFETVDHHAWPVVYLDGSTQESRLQELYDENIKEMAHNMPSVDMILNGVAIEKVEETAVAYAATTAICYVLHEKKADYHKPKGSLDYQQYHERINNALGWLLKQEPEVAIMGARTMLVLFGLIFDPKLVSNWQGFVGTYEDLIVRSPTLK